MHRPVQHSTATGLNGVPLASLSQFRNPLKAWVADSLFMSYTLKTQVTSLVGS